MSFTVWIVGGLIAGVIASKIVNATGKRVFLDIVLGAMGAVVGGYLIQTFGMTGVTGLNSYSFFVALAGSIVVLLPYHALIRRRA